MKLIIRKGLHGKVFSLNIKSLEQGRKLPTVSSALPETAASVAIAATVVGAAATLLVRRTKSSEETEIPLKTCEDCGGSGICSECNGEGFVLKKLSEKSAERARLTAKNMATRYTAGLPKKWSYCTKCSSARSCSTCGGRGKISL
ncbi:Cell division cycle protein 48-like protein [Melia azedarach]|nr:Cell division cycle protein 48-like protein [Melia azedarach]